MTRLLLWLLCCRSVPAVAGPGTLIAQLEGSAVSESSGLARGSTDGTYWTHNDSGGKPVLYGFDRAGGRARAIAVRGAEAVDWEEIASFEKAGHHWLMVADTGDNRRRRSEVVLYLVREPAADEPVDVALSLRFRYPDGAHDCEGMVVDPKRGEVLLITKDRGDGTLVYTLPLSGDVTQAIPVTTLELGDNDASRRVVAADLSPDGSKLVVLTYEAAWEWERAESWQTTFAGTPRKIAIPTMQQGEAVAYSHDGTSLLFTSEGVPMPLIELDPG